MDLKSIEIFYNHYWFSTCLLCLHSWNLEYCAPLFTQWCVSLSDAIERAQKRCHKIICNVSHNECDCVLFLPLQYRRLVLGFQLFSDLVINVRHPLHHLAPPKLKFSGKFCVPRCTTAQRSKSFIVSMLKLASDGFSIWVLEVLAVLVFLIILEIVFVSLFLCMILGAVNLF